MSRGIPDLSRTRIRLAVEARARGQGRQVGGHRNCHRQNHVAHTHPPRGNGQCMASLPPLKQEAVGTSESHPISLPLPPSTSSHPSVGPSVCPSPLSPLFLPPSFVFPHLNGPFNEGEKKRARPPRPSSRLRPPPAQTILEFGAIRLSTEGGRERATRPRIWGEGN